MTDIAYITLRPVSNYDFHDLEYSVALHDHDFNRAVCDALRSAKKSFKDCPIIRFDVVSIEVI